MVRYELGITSRCDSWLLKLLNLMNMGWTTPNPCTVDEIATKNSKKLTWVHMKDFRFYITMKQVPFDSDKYLLIFDQKCVLHNQDEKLVSCSLMNWEKFVKTSFTQKFFCQKAILANFNKFYSFWQVFWKAKSSLESKILEFGFNPHTSHKITQTFTVTLLLSISKSQLHKWGLRGQKWGFI